MSEESARDIVLLLKEWIYPQLTRLNKQMNYLVDEVKRQGQANPSGHNNKDREAKKVPEQQYGSQSEEERKRKEEEERKQREGQGQPGQGPHQQPGQGGGQKPGQPGR
jgi:hypothetical protein